MRRNKKYLDYIINPIESLRTKKVLQVNPTISPSRTESVESRIIVYEYNKDKSDFWQANTIEDCFPSLQKTENSWINIDGLRKNDVEKICLQTAALNRPELISEIANRYGSQAVVISLDIKAAAP